MHLPFIGKTQKPAPWLIGAMAAGTIAVSGTGFLIARTLAPRQAITTATAPVEAKTVTVRIAASGEVIPYQTVNLSPKSAGQIAQILVDQGDRVEQGQIVARMDSQDVDAERIQAQARVAEAQAKLNQLKAGTRIEEIRQAEAEVSRAQSEINRVRRVVADANSALEFARRQTGRQQELADQGAIAVNALDEFQRKEQTARETVGQAQAQLSQAQAQYEQAVQQLRQQRNGARPEEIAQADAQLTSAKGQLRGVENRMEDSFIRAPFAGIITQRYATVGAFVTPTTQASATADGATSTSIFALANGLEVRARVPEVDIGQIRQGQEVDIRVDAYPDQVFKGRVRRIAPEAIVDRDVTSFEVRVALLTGKDQLRSKMNADVSFLGEKLDNTVVVPTAALSTNRGKTGVWVPGTEKPTFQTVKTGLTFDNETQIVSGLQSGDLIYVQPPEGQKLGTPDS
ncbi:efflux RND transporter periplasmic adaptor subunit [Myxacorys almedinensis]|uniref:Efflux RND transporter periplasmic adaptor subunit n=1 Tax=Myxacorys almedinensis A TaxID=2690445 RepID=A0A8J8CJZ1_9CYAN|nr:efflux RND transporter periplasmic adaptor subunit [Myxacorys almedinensis]NDJ19069.1 efflux RND transporter periplasmic adaptor subunit [Myxacorys almedinensis A]